MHVQQLCSPWATDPLLVHKLDHMLEKVEHPCIRQSGHERIFAASVRLHRKFNLGLSSASRVSLFHAASMFDCAGVVMRYHNNTKHI